MTTTPIMFAGTPREILDHGELLFIGTGPELAVDIEYVERGKPWALPFRG